MASINGLKKITATDIQNSGRFYLGNQLDTGTAGQALVSAGPNEPARWDTHTGTIQPLTIGTNLSLASGNTTFDGGTADTLNATGGSTLTPGSGIDITGTTISTKPSLPLSNTAGNIALNYASGQAGLTVSAGQLVFNPDTTTIGIDGSSPHQVKVLKVPNALTINGTDYDGSSSQSFNLATTDTTYTPGDGMSLTTTTFSTNNDETTISNSTGENKVLKVPNDLTFTGYATGTYNGSSALSINLVDTDTTYTAGNGIQISGSNIIQTKTDNITIRDSGGGPSKNLEVIKVPNALTAGNNVSFSSGTTYDGSAAIIINASDTDTTYQGGTGISIDTATNPDTINCASIPNTALQNSTISGVSLGSNLANLTFYNSNGGFITSYNGANPPTSVTLDGDTTYQGGKNITVDTSTNPDTINLDDDLNNIDIITMTSGPGGTAIAGNNYPSNPTTCSYLDLSSPTNVFPDFGGIGVGGTGGIYKDTANGFLYRFLLPSDFLNDNDSSGYARSVIADSGNHGAQQCYAGSQYYAFFTIPDGYYFSGFRVNLVNSAGTPQGTTPTSSWYVNVYTKTIDSNLSVVGTTKGFNTNNLGYTITSGYSASWDINDPITIGAIHCFRNSWNSAYYNRGGWIQYTEGTPPSGK